jgi:hypothetical protein
MRVNWSMSRVITAAAIFAAVAGCAVTAAASSLSAARPPAAQHLYLAGWALGKTDIVDTL